MKRDDQAMFEAVVAALDRLYALDQSDRDALSALPLTISRDPPHHYLIREGSRPATCCILLEGYACRHKKTSSGERQIVSFHIPGDVLDVQHLELDRADHNIQTITAATVAWVPKSEMQALLTRCPSIGKALWRAALVDASVFREWVLNVGRRDALSRVAHMLCEFAARRDAAGIGQLQRFELPMTQEHIADATGLTPVHVNRMFRLLGEHGVIARDRRDLTIVDWEGMRRIADFDPAYLHLAA